MFRIWPVSPSCLFCLLGFFCFTDEERRTQGRERRTKMRREGQRKGEIDENEERSSGRREEERREEGRIERRQRDGRK